MAASSASARKTSPAFPTSDAVGERPNDYGSLVGNLIDQIEMRFQTQSGRHDVVEIEEDFAHRVSVFCGYAGLALGFGVTVLGIASMV